MAPPPSSPPPESPATADSVPPRYNVIGFGISALTFGQARELIVAQRGRVRRGYVCLGTVHSLIAAGDEPGLRRIFNTSWLTTPDGMPLVWLGPRGVERVYGPDLLLAVCATGRAVGLRHYFYGGAPGVATELAARLVARFPGLEIVGTHTPPFRPLEPAEFTAWRAEIARLRPDVIWVGLGSPKQERFMAAHWRDLDAGVLIGVGAAFDFHSGRVPQAPRWMQRSGLEWLFRLGTEPRRLGPRYLRANPLFLLRLFAQKTGLRRYPLESPGPDPSL
ncbi:MAG: WecB/TagA/CpsF family glycosyltransferase [Verrucomicrobia bacterium]|nr:WecB/TagA/CpsF family glycosyltransferase [Verrucomicrobiota bacterium]